MCATTQTPARSLSAAHKSYHNSLAAQDGLFSGATVATTFNLTWYAVRVPSVGLATAQGIVSTFNALVSFGVGVLLFRNPITSWVEAACGLGLLCAGISLVVAAKFVSKEMDAPSSESALLSEDHEQGRKTWTCSSTRSDPSTARGPALQSIDSVGSTAVMPDASASSSVLVFASSTAALPEVAEAGPRNLADDSMGRKRLWAGILQRLFGWACAAGAGTAGGFTLAGLTLSPAGCQGIVYLPAVGVGCILTQVAWLGMQGIYYALFIRRDEESLLATFAEQLRYNTRSFRYVVAGITAGIIYGAGLLLSLVSTYYVGEALAGPIFQFNISSSMAFGARSCTARSSGGRGSRSSSQALCTRTRLAHTSFSLRNRRQLHLKTPSDRSLPSDRAYLPLQALCWWSELESCWLRPQTKL